MEFYYAGGATATPYSAYLGRGDLLLNFLRYATENELLIKHFPKTIFIGAILYLLHLYFSKSYIFKEMYKLLKYINIFIIIALVSAVANLDFHPKVILFLVHFLFPVVVFYYIIAIKLSNIEKSRLFAYLMFICFEMQLFFTILQNLHNFLNGQWAFGDKAIGTFAFPMSQVSSALLAIALLFFLSNYIINHKKKDLLKVFIAFLGILSASVFFFTILLLISIFGFMIIYFSSNIIFGRVKTMMYLILFGIIMTVPIIYIIQNPQNYYNTYYFVRKMEANRAKKITEVSKIYSFINLGNMMVNENKYILGAGPGNFLTNVGKKYNSPLTVKYCSWNVLGGLHGSGEWIENSFVGLVGEIGFFGWLFYFLFYFTLFKKYLFLTKENSYNKERNSIYLFLSATFAFFLIYSFFTELFEIKENIIPLVIFAALVYKQSQNNLNNSNKKIV